MTKKAWIEHIEDVTGIIAPTKSLGVTMNEWRKALQTHKAQNPDCEACKSRAKTRRANRNRRWRDEAYAAVGMKKVRGNLGGTYYEDVEKKKLYAIYFQTRDNERDMWHNEEMGIRAKNEEEAIKKFMTDIPQRWYDEELIRIMDIEEKTWMENVYKYGTKEEIQFLLEMGILDPAQEFVATLMKIKNNPQLAKTLEKDLELLKPYQKDSATFYQWIRTDPQAKELLEKFKNILKGRGPGGGGGIYKGAFSTNK